MLGFLSKYVSYLLIVFIVGGIVGFIYYKGRRDMELKVIRQQMEEINRRYKEERKVIDQGDRSIQRFRRKVKEYKDNPTPDNQEQLDKYYECLMGDNPLSCK